MLGVGVLDGADSVAGLERVALVSSEQQVEPHAGGEQPEIPERRPVVDHVDDNRLRVDGLERRERRRDVRRGEEIGEEMADTAHG